MVSEKKKLFVQNLVKQIQEYPIVGLVNMENLPAQQLQNMRAMLRDKGIQIVMARKKLLTLGLKESKKDAIEQLVEKIKGMPALIFSKDNPFILYSIIQKNKSEAPAKAGQTAPREIIVKAGPTSFAPGPIISELAAVGIKTKVDGGKLTIIDDTVVAKEGDEITPVLAEMLKRLDIKPMEVGLDLVAVWEDGLVFGAKELHIDEAEYLANITNAAQWAMNLAMEVGYLTNETTELLLQKAAREAKAVALEQNIITDETKDEILAKAESQALSVKETGKIEVGTAPAKKEEAPKEEVKAEEKPAEVPVAEEKVEEVPKEVEEEKPVEEVAPEEKKTEEPVAEEPKVTETEEQKPVEEKPAEEIKEEEEEEEPKAEETTESKDSEPAPEEQKPAEEDIQKAMENIPDEKIELGDEPKEETGPTELHPKQGDISTDQAQELLEKLQKEGTLRDN